MWRGPGQGPDWRERKWTSFGLVAPLKKHTEKVNEWGQVMNERRTSRIRSPSPQNNKNNSLLIEKRAVTFWLRFHQVQLFSLSNFLSMWVRLELLGINVWMGIDLFVLLITSCLLSYVNISTIMIKASKMLALKFIVDPVDTISMTLQEQRV